MKIEVRNLMKSFKNNKILNNVNIAFEDGHIYGLIGRNGSGKSVFLKTLCALYEPNSGEILYDGLSLDSNQIPPDTRALIEKPSFIGELTGYENLELLASIQGKIGNKEIENALNEVNLFSEKDKKFNKYSLGMKQKLGIAQVLMEDPKVIILDEPFNGIEEQTVIKIRKTLLKEKEKGKIIIIASHIKEDIEYLADVIYEFDNGNVKKVSKQI